MATLLNLSQLSDALPTETDAATGHVGIGPGDATLHGADAEFSTALGEPRTPDQLNDSDEESPTTLVVPGYRRSGPSEIQLDGAGEASPRAADVRGYLGSRKIQLNDSGEKYDSGEQSPTAPQAEAGTAKRAVRFGDKADILYLQKYSSRNKEITPTKAIDPETKYTADIEEINNAGERALAIYVEKASGPTVKSFSNDHDPTDVQLAEAATNRDFNEVAIKSTPEKAAEEPRGRAALDIERPAFLADSTRSDDLPTESKGRKSKLLGRLKQFFRSDKTARR